MDELRMRVVPTPWNKGKPVGQKAPLKLKEIWAIRVRLQVFSRTRELALFDLGIDSKLRACDLLKLKVRDVCHGERVAARAIVVQQKTSRPVQFEITESTRTALTDWIRLSGLASENFFFPSRVRASPHLSVRQYARIVDSWVEEIGLDPGAYGTHSIRWTKPSLIYRRTKNCALCSFCWVPSSKAPSDILASRWRTPWSWRSKQRCDSRLSAGLIENGGVSSGSRQPRTAGPAQMAVISRRRAESAKSTAGALHDRPCEQAVNAGKRSSAASEVAPGPAIP